MNLNTELLDKLSEYKKILNFIRTSKDDIIHIPNDVIQSIEKNIHRLEKFQFSIAAFGETNSGKSALLNSLVGANNANASEQIFEVCSDINHWSDNISLTNGKEVHFGDDINIMFYDTPGIAGDIEQHLDIALSIASDCDILLFVVFEPIKNELQVPVIKKLLESNKEFIFVINKTDIRRQEEIESIENDIIAKFNVPKGKIVCCAGYPINGSPQIDDLVEKIVSIIAIVQGNLITQTIEAQLNKPYQQIIDEIEQQSLKSQEEANSKFQEHLLIEQQDKKERLVLDHIIIHGSATGAGASALALAKVPGGDELALTSITVAMTTALCKNYNKLSRQVILAYLNVISGSLLGKIAASYLYRFIPFFGEIINCGVTATLHEIQGWLIVSFLEKGLYTKEDIEKNNIGNLKKEAEKLRATANEIRNSPDMSIEQLNKLKMQAEQIKRETKDFSDSIAKQSKKL